MDHLFIMLAAVEFKDRNEPKSSMVEESIQKSSRRQKLGVAEGYTDTKFKTCFQDDFDDSIGEES